MEGLLVASKIADRVGITRSVIVNALRKFESAGLIETKSLGMKAKGLWGRGGIELVAGILIPILFLACF